MRRLTLIFLVLVIAALTAAAGWSSWTKQRLSTAWLQNYNEARARDDCGATRALLTVGVAAGHAPAWTVWAESSANERCGLSDDAAWVDYLRSVGERRAGPPIPDWLGRRPFFEIWTLWVQADALLRGDDPLLETLRIRLERDCAALVFGNASQVPRLRFLAHVTRMPTPSMQRAVSFIAAEAEACRAGGWRVIERAERLEDGDWTPRTCEALFWQANLFNDPEASHRLATECENGETVSLIHTEDGSSDTFFQGAHSGLRAAASMGHLSAARDYARRMRETIEEAESTPQIDTSWFAYIYARRAQEAGIDDGALARFFSSRLSDRCRSVADAFFDHLERAWSGAEADWEAAARIFVEAQPCGPYAGLTMDQLAFLLDNPLAVPEFALHFGDRRTYFNADWVAFLPDSSLSNSVPALREGFEDN